MNNLPVVTKNLLIINVLCFMGALVARRYGVDLNDLLGLHFFMASDFKLYQLVTYMFMHGDFQHIFFNMFAVWMFGRTLEQVMGPKRFLTYYMICGIGAGLVVLGAGFGLGKIGAAALEGAARQPEAAGDLRTTMIIIAALLEGAAMLGLVICLLTMVMK